MYPIQRSAIGGDPVGIDVLLVLAARDMRREAERHDRELKVYGRFVDNEVR
jgi:hypothetical protein